MLGRKEENTTNTNLAEEIQKTQTNLIYLISTLNISNTPSRLRIRVSGSADLLSYLIISYLDLFAALLN